MYINRLFKYSPELTAKWKIDSSTLIFRFFSINVFTFKDRIPLFFRSGIAYKFLCGGCNVNSCYKTKRHFRVRMCQHLGTSPLTGKTVDGDDDSAMKEYVCSAITQLDLKNSQLSLPTTTTT